MSTNDLCRVEAKSGKGLGRLTNSLDQEGMVGWFSATNTLMGGRNTELRAMECDLESDQDRAERQERERKEEGERHEQERKEERERADRERKEERGRADHERKKERERRDRERRGKERT